MTKIETGENLVELSGMGLPPPKFFVYNFIFRRHARHTLVHIYLEGK